MEPNEDNNRQSPHFHSVEPSTAVVETASEDSEPSTVVVEATSVDSEKRERESQRESAATLSRSVAKERREIDIGMTQDISSESEKSSSLCRNGRDSSLYSKSRGSNVKYFPLDLIKQILLRLPVRSIVKCTSVCKDWYSFIKNHEFIEAHRFHRLIASPPSYFIDFRCSHCPKRFITFHSDNGSSCQIHLIPNYKYYGIIGIVHGLIYYSGADDNNGFIWNPSILRYFSIPDEPSAEYPKKPIHRDIMQGFGFSSVKNDYRVVKIVFYRNDHGVRFLRAGVYSLKESSWKMLDLTALFSFTRFSDRSYFANGSIHWIVVNQSNFILSLDMNDECFKTVMLPAELVMAHYLELFISETKGLLSIFHLRDEDFVGGMLFNCCDIWVQKDSSLENSWSKICQIHFEGKVLLSVLEVRENDEISIVKERDGGVVEIAFYDPMTRETKPFGVSIRGEFFYAGSYNESLVLLDRVDHSYDEPIKIKEANRNLMEGMDFGTAYLEWSLEPVSDDEEEDEFVSDDEEEDDIVSDEEEEDEFVSDDEEEDDIVSDEEEEDGM